MLFNSYEFIFVFLPIVLLLYFLLAKMMGNKEAKFFLIGASLLFYSYWDIRNLPVLLLSIAINFFVGNRLNNEKSKKWLIVGVFFNFALLGYFKYTNFVVDCLNQIGNFGFSQRNIILPLGISFFTFTQTAYLVDAYRGETVSYSKSDYLLFVTIFPHLIAGPIIYHKNIIPQFSEGKRYVFNFDNFAKGLVWFVAGLFKKVVVADWLGLIANTVFTDASNLSFLEAWGGSIAYSLQLFYDFSGYSEMAVGLALMLNYDLPINFNAPYKACSIIDFWRRWHITLSTFLKNYLYIPLGGNRDGNHLRNIFITMFLGGLWHGAGWTFIIWGCLHGCFICINHLWRKTNINLPSIVSWFLTFNAVNIAWVFFKADSLKTSFEFIRAMFDITSFSYPHSRVIAKWIPSNLLNKDFLFSSNDVLWIVILLISSTCFYSLEDYMNKKFSPKVSIAVFISVAFVYAVAQLNKMSEFLYFQF